MEFQRAVMGQDSRPTEFKTLGVDIVPGRLALILQRRHQNLQKKHAPSGKVKTYVFARILRGFDLVGAESQRVNDRADACRQRATRSENFPSTGLLNSESY